MRQYTIERRTGAIKLKKKKKGSRKIREKTNCSDTDTSRHVQGLREPRGTRLLEWSPEGLVSKSMESCSLFLAAAWVHSRTFSGELGVALWSVGQNSQQAGRTSTNWNALATLCPSVTPPLTTVTFREQWLPLHSYSPNLSPISLLVKSIPELYICPAVFQQVFGSVFPLVVTRWQQSTLVWLSLGLNSHNDCVGSSDSCCISCRWGCLYKWGLGNLYEVFSCGSRVLPSCRNHFDIT